MNKELYKKYVVDLAPGALNEYENNMDMSSLLQADVNLGLLEYSSKNKKPKKKRVILKRKKRLRFYSPLKPKEDDYINWDRIDWG